MGAAAPPPPANRLPRLRVAAAAAIFAGLPYAALKVAWLWGSSVGSATALGARHCMTADTASATSRRSRWSSSR